MNSFKKNTSIIFLLIIVSMPLLYSIYTITEKKMIEYRMSERLELEHLQIFTLDVSSVIWLKINKEMLINGQPFDVKAITKEGNMVTVSGLFDGPEERLGKQLKKYNNSTDKTASTNKSLLLLFFATYYHEPGKLTLNIPFSFYKRHSKQFHQDKICSLFNEILIPPPRLS